MACEMAHKMVWIGHKMVCILKNNPVLAHNRMGLVVADIQHSGNPVVDRMVDSIQGAAAGSYIAGVGNSYIPGAGNSYIPGAGNSYIPGPLCITHVSNIVTSRNPLYTINHPLHDRVTAMQYISHNQPHPIMSLDRVILQTTGHPDHPTSPLKGHPTSP